MKFIIFIFTLLLMTLVSTSPKAQEQKQFDQLFKKSSYQALHVLTAQEGNTLDQDQRELGKLTIADDNGQHFLRVEFSDILRMPEIHFETKTEIANETQNQDNLEIATKEYENLIVTSPYYKHKFPILGVEKMNESAVEYFKKHISELESASGKKIKLTCQTRQIKTDQFHNVCVDEDNNNRQILELISSLRHQKYCHMIIRTKLQNYSLLLPLYVPADEFEDKLNKIFVNIEKSKAHDQIELEDIWLYFEELVKEIDPDCELLGEQDDLGPNLIIGEVVDGQYAEDFYGESQEEANASESTEGNNQEIIDTKKVKKIRKLKQKIPQSTFTLKRNNFIENIKSKDQQYFKNLRKKRKLTQQRKLPKAEKDGECDFEAMQIQINFYNLKLFNYVQIRLISEGEHTAGHIIAKTDSKGAKDQIHTQFEQYIQDLMKIKSIHQKIMSTEKDSNVEPEVYKDSDFENLIKQEFGDIKQTQTSHGMIFKQNTNDLIEIKKRGNEFQITFYAPHHDQQDDQKVYTVLNISYLKDNEHMQFFEKELHNYGQWVKNSSKQF